MTITVEETEAPKETTISLGTDNSSSEGNTTLENTATTVSKIYTLTPEGLQFASPVTISLPYDANVTGTLKVYLTKFGDTSIFEEVPNATFNNGIATVQITHFSKIAVAAENASSSCNEGTEDCPCYSNSTCNDGLSCTNDICKEPPAPACGDGTVDSNDACDDGNTIGGDGCSATCLKEIGEQCTQNADCDDADFLSSCGSDSICRRDNAEICSANIDCTSICMDHDGDGGTTTPTQCAEPSATGGVCDEASDCDSTAFASTCDSDSICRRNDG